MHKCFKCGTEFEGKFCPECGTEWKENKVCPQCGATLAGNVKFCNQCGYAFAEQEKPKEKKDNKFVLGMKKFGAWLKKHLKVVVPVTAAALVLIVICSLIPTFIVASVNGTYYRLTSDGEFVNEDFITLSTGKWTDGKTKGTYALKGGAITVKADIEKVSGTEDWGDLGDLVGDLEQEASTRKGEIKNGVIKFTDKSRTEIYCKKNHKHKYGKWETVTEPTCTAEGERTRVCFCEHVEKAPIEAPGHAFQGDACKNCGIGRKFTDGLEYKINEDGKTCCVSGIGTLSGDVTISETINGLRITSIGNSAFEGCSSLTSITIPDGVTSIGRSAFKGCSGLTSITIPDGVTSIGNSAFYGCRGLTSISVESGSKYYHVMGNCLIETETKTLIKGFSNSVIPSDGSVTSIGSYAFSSCNKLTSISIPDSVTSIGGEAFSGCSSLTSITIGNSITSIEHSAFEECSSLTGVYITDLVAWCKISFGSNWHGDISTCYSNPLTYAHNLYLNDTLVTELIIPDDITSIGDFALCACSIARVSIPDSVTSIGNYAFSSCSSLTSIAIPNSVISIGGSAFYGCSDLTSVTIGNGVTSIRNSAFKGCSSLKSVTIGNSVTSIGEAAFSGCSSLTSISIPNSVTSIEKGAFYGCNNLIQTENGAQYVDKWVINCDTDKSSVALRANAVGIADFAFYGCSGLTSITIPDSVISIGIAVFYDCSGLTSIVIPNGVTSIENSAFYGCSGLTSVTIPDSVTSIEKYAFAGCSRLTNIIFEGTKAAWRAIGYDEYYNAGDYTVQCTDGKLDKVGYEIE